MYNDKIIEEFVKNGDGIDPFADVLPTQISKLHVNSNRISVDKTNQVFVTLSNTSPFAEYIFSAISEGTLSDWFIGLKDNRHYLRYIKEFVLFLNNYSFDTVNRYKVLKDFESFKVNEEGLKPQSTGLSNLINLITNGIESSQLPNDQILYLITLTNTTKPSKSSDRTPHTLNHWFNISWLKSYIGEDAFLKLESPKLLMGGFNVTIATTLSYLISAKKELKEKIKNNQISMEQLCSSGGEYSKLTARNKTKYSQNLFQLTANFDLGKPLDKSTQCMLLDLVNQVPFERVMETIKIKGVKAVPFLFHAKTNKKINFTKSNLFTPQYLNAPSPIEELLFSWLVSSQMVQPEDVFKLKRNHFIFERNSQGTVILAQCIYYKGRTGDNKETPLLNKSDIELSALIDYFSILPDGRKELFSKACPKNPRLVTPYIEGSAQPSMIAFLFRLLETDDLSKTITNAIISKGVSNLFYKSFLGLNKSSSISYDAWRKNSNKTREEYIKEVNEPLPINIFRSAHIKTSAVYSKTDLYRESDLVNYNSHTAHTEKMSYLSDSNKDWVNQCGRISRLVFNEIEGNIYKPNVEAVDFHTNEQIIKTKVLKATGTTDGKVNTIGQYKGSEITDADDSGLVMVIDSVETAVNMLHYIKQADLFANKLLDKNPKFFERTLLVNVEWMHYVLDKLSISTVKEAQSFYSANFKNFPNIFEDELRGGVTS